MRRVGRAPALPPVDPNAVAALIAPSSPTPHRRASSPAHSAQASPLHRPHLRPAAGGRGHPVGAANPVTSFELSGAARCGAVGVAGGARLSRWDGTAACRSPARIPDRRSGTGSGSRSTLRGLGHRTRHTSGCVLTVRVGPMGKHRRVPKPSTDGHQTSSAGRCGHRCWASPTSRAGSGWPAVPAP